MAQIHHFDHGWITPTISYMLSVLGSLLGLTLAVKFRSARSNAERTWWLILAAVAIGGTAIWSMHFVAMLGFSVDGSPIRYDVGLTAASAIIAVAAVAVGLSIAALGNGGGRNARIVTGGVISGLGVAGMHYTGMAAMHLNGEISYGMTRVALSIAIAVVAATVALWLAVAGIALLSTVMAITLYFAGLERIGPVRASTLSTIEPICTVVLAAIVLDESIAPVQLAGGALILAAAVLIARARAD